MYVQKTPEGHMSSDGTTARRADDQHTVCVRGIESLELRRLRNAKQICL